MPTWRERGAHPRSVTLRVAASSAPSTAASGPSSSYSSGVTPVPTPMTTGARASVSTSSSRRSASTRTRPRVPAVRVCTGTSRRGRGGGAGSTPGRTVTICVALRHVMSATRAPANAGLAATRTPSRAASAMASPTSPECVAAAARPATSRPNAVLGASTAHGAVSCTSAASASATSSAAAEPRQHEHEVGSCRPQRGGVHRAPRRGVARVGAQRVDGRTHLVAEARRRAEELLGHPLTAGLGEDGDDPGGTPVPGPVVTRRRRRRVGARRQGATSAELAHGLLDHRRRPDRRASAWIGRAPWAASPRPPSGSPPPPRAPGRAGWRPCG